MTHLILAFVLAILIVSFFYILKSPNITTESFHLPQESKVDKSLQKALNFFGGDISALIPQSIKKKNNKSSKLRKLFITSANPWDITMEEFLVIKIFMGLGALVLGTIAFLILQSTLSIYLRSIFLIGFVLLGYFYPNIKYSSVADDRISAFKKELPEAIDFLVIATSGGTFSLPIAIEKSIPYMREGVMKEEFNRIIESLNSGKSLEASLDDFAKRAPTEGIEAFVNSLNNASKLNAPITSLLKNRAEASRKERSGEIDKRIASLSTKIMVAFTPTSYIAVLIIIGAPVLNSLSGAL